MQCSIVMHCNALKTCNAMQSSFGALQWSDFTPNTECSAIYIVHHMHSVERPTKVVMEVGTLHCSVSKRVLWGEFVCKWATPRTSADPTNADYRAASPTPPYTSTQPPPSNALNSTELQEKELQTFCPLYITHQTMHCHSF